MTRVPRIAGACALAVMLALAVASPAGAATVSSSGGVITFQAAAGEANSANVDRSFSGSEFILRDSNATVTAGPGCYVGSEYVPGDIYCPGSASRIRFNLGDGNDTILVYSSVGVSVTTEINAGEGGFQSIRSESPGPTVITGGAGTERIATFGGDDNIDAGAGDDYIDSGAGHDAVNAGPGTDEVRAGPGADEVQGGSGADLLYGDAGMDVVNGGADDDRLYGEQDADVLNGDDGNDWLHDDGSFEQGFASGDILNGGPGRDLADYGSRGGTLPVTITLDGAANDGSAQESDNVGPAGDIEIVEGSGNDDVLIGSDRGEELRGGFGNDKLDGLGGDDVLDGFGGNDQLAGGDGNDTLEGSADSDGLLGEGGDDRLTGGTGNDSLGGGPGADVLDGGLDSDTMLARDGIVDQIRCSLGSDAVEADSNDTFLDRSGCEKITGAASAPSTGGLAALGVSVDPTHRLSTVLRVGLAFRVQPPGAGRMTFELLLTRTVARRLGLAAAAKPVVIGRMTRATSGRSTLVKLKLTKKARKRLRRARRVTVTLRMTFTSTTGARKSASRKLTLRR